MTSDEKRRMRMLDSADDAMILPDEQIQAMHDELDRLYERKRALDAEIGQIWESIHASGEARVRKLRRHGTDTPPASPPRVRKLGRHENDTL